MSDHHTHQNGHGMGHGSAEDFLRRFWVVTFLLIPLVFVHERVIEFLGIPLPEYLGNILAFLLSTVIFGFSLVFFRHASHEIRAKQYGMMTLVSLAIGAGYAFSVVATFLPALEMEFYIEISTLIWILLFGHYLEARSGAAAGDALSEIAKLLPKKAHKLEDGKETDVDIATLSEGDIVLVKPGEKVPADGTVQDGTAHVNESLISGESKPIQKKVGDEVIAGSICLDGSLTIILSRVGEHSTIGQIRALISKAQQTKPAAARMADKAAGMLTFAAGITAILTLLVWFFILGETFAFAITLAITVLVIACPHALGLAIPTVTTITTSLAAKNGIFIKDLSKIEVIRKAGHVVFDKTGTLTKGEFGVTSIIPLGDTPESDLLHLAASLEQHSSHIIGISIVRHAQKQNISLSPVTEFANLAGKGARGNVEYATIHVGNAGLMRELDLLSPDVEHAYKIHAEKGETTIFIANETRVLGLVTLADEVRPEAWNAVAQLHDLGIKVAMLTGDNEQVTRNVAQELSIDTYFAEVLPEDKYKHIQTLQEDGSVVLMIGDGVNDAPALTQADVGVAIGTGTDVAVEAGDVVLTQNNPEDVARLIFLSKKAYSKMIQNLFWALGYNIIAIPAAAGVFAYWGFFLPPSIGALVMSLSTVIVVLNALMLRTYPLSHLK